MAAAFTGVQRSQPALATAPVSDGVLRSRGSGVQRDGVGQRSRRTRRRVRGRAVERETVSRAIRMLLTVGSRTAYPRYAGAKHLLVSDAVRLTVS